MTENKLTIEDVGKVIRAISSAMNGENSYRTVLRITLEELGIEYDPRAYQECLPLLYINNEVSKASPLEIRGIDEILKEHEEKEKNK